MAKKQKTEEQSIVENTAAAETLKPDSMPAEDPKSRFETLAAMIGNLAQVDTATLTKLNDAVLAQVGSDHFSGEDNSAKNAKSVSTGSGGSIQNALGIAVKEDVEQMFVGQELSEEFKTKAVVLFEAAVNARVATEVVRVEEEAEKQIDETVEALATDMIEKLDGYLNYVTEEWMKENEVAIESSIRNDLTSEFIEGLKSLFAEHYIAIPEDKVDVVEALSQKVDALEKELNDVLAENAELSEIAIEAAKDEVVEQAADGLALTQVEKLKTLVAGVEFTDPQDYQNKVNVIKENYFPASKKTDSEKKGAEMLNEANEEHDEPEKTLSPTMQRYFQTIRNHVASER